MPYNTQGWGATMFERLADVPAIVGVKDPCVDDLPMFRAIQLLGDRFVLDRQQAPRPGRRCTCATRWACRASRPA